MTDRRPIMPQQVGSGSDLPLDDWLNLASIMRQRRSRLIGEDLFIDPAWGIFLALGRSENQAGLSFNALVNAAGQSAESTCRWVTVLMKRKLVKRVGDDLFVLSVEGMDRLQRIFA
jgi:hypothetical protein